MKVIDDIKKHSFLGKLSLFLAISVIIILSMQFILLVIIPEIAVDWYSLQFLMFDNTFFVLLYLTPFTAIFGLITKKVKNDSFGKVAILIGILGFIVNWLMLFFAFSKLDF